jgi:aspartate/methionine/tyrosine aminotransferase
MPKVAMVPFAAWMEWLGTESAFEYLTKAKQLEAQGREIIHLEIGQPDFPTAPHICEAAYQAMQADHTGYATAAGLPELKALLSHHISLAPRKLRRTLGQRSLPPQR